MLAPEAKLCPRPTSYQGVLDPINLTKISGFAWDANHPSVAQSVTIYDGATAVATVAQANQPRTDLSSLGIDPYHGFSISTPPALLDGRPHQISARVSTVSLDNAPQALQSGWNAASGETGTVIDCVGPSPTHQQYAAINQQNIPGDGNTPIRLLPGDSFFLYGVATVPFHTPANYSWDGASLSVGLREFAGVDNLTGPVVAGYGPYYHPFTNLPAIFPFYVPDGSNRIINISDLNPQKTYTLWGDLKIQTSCWTGLNNFVNLGPYDYFGTAFQIKVEPQPTLTSVLPAVVPANTYTPLTLYGSGFGKSGTVHFGPLHPDMAYSNTALNAMLKGTDQSAEIDLTNLSLPVGGYNIYITVDTAADNSSFQQRPPGQAPTSNSKTVTSGAAPVAPPPSLTVTSDLLRYPNQSLSQTNCAMIDGTPRMPQFTARIVDSLGQAVSGTASFSLNVIWDQLHQDVDQNGIPIGSPYVIAQWPYSFLPSSSPLDASQPWTIRPLAIIGGSATLNWAFNGAIQPPFKFCIQSYNPSFADATAGLNATPWWFLQNISIHETNMSNVCEPNRNQGTPYCISNVAMPTFGPPGGYGMLQIDPPADFSSVWDWRSNVIAGSGVAATKASNAYNFWLNQIDQWDQFNAAHDGRTDIPPRPEPPLQDETGNCEFLFSRTAIQSANSPSQHWFGDAILLKQYAGAIQNYIYWNNTGVAEASVDWAFAKSNNVNWNVVKEFCSCTQPDPSVGQGVCVRGKKVPW